MEANIRLLDVAEMAEEDRQLPMLFQTLVLDGDQVPVGARLTTPGAFMELGAVPEFTPFAERFARRLVTEAVNTYVTVRLRDRGRNAVYGDLHCEVNYHTLRHVIFDGCKGWNNVR